MFTFQTPPESLAGRLLSEWEPLDPSYSAVGCTRRSEAPRGFWRDETTLPLGRGEAVYRLACEHIMSAAFYPAAMARLFARRRPLATGDTLVVAYRVPILPLSILMPTRVVYTFDEVHRTSGVDIHLAGFAYGTLPGHAEAGEERFEVGWNEATDEVWFRILVDARPAWLLAWVGFWFTRFEQFRFRRLATTQMKRLVAVRPQAASLAYG